jgi:SAM-dependent methyltransferase
MTLVNRTRVSTSIPARLLSEGKLWLLPVYCLARTSFAGREAIEHSGSYQFADHLYVGLPRGRFGFGSWIDKLLLSLPSSRSFRSRFIHARDGIVDSLRRSDRSFYKVLSVPCGIPRELMEAAEALRAEDPALLERTAFYGLDLDAAVLREAQSLLTERRLGNFHLIHGDAFDLRAYPGGLDIIASTGLTEFLTDQQAVHFYKICFQSLRPGGVLLTSSTVRHPVSDYLLRNIAELLAHYREERDVRAIFQQTSFGGADLRRDAIGYQVLITARKPAGLAAAE